VLNELGLDKQLSCFKYHRKGVIKYRQAFEIIYIEKGKRGQIKREMENLFSVDSMSEDNVSKEYREEFVFFKSGRNL
jgi:hypothetical protein